MNSKWHYQERGKIKGPLTAAGLAFLFEQEAIAQKTLVRNGTTGEWCYLGDVMVFSNDGTVTIQEESVTREDLTSERFRHRNAGRLDRLSRRISGTVEHVTDFLSVAFGRLAFAFTRRDVLATVLIVCLILLVRKSTLLETPIADAYHHLSAVWRKAEELRRKDRDEKDWEAFAFKTKADIAPLARELKQAQEQPPDAWSIIFGVCEDQKEAQQDLVQIACNELPALLSGEPTGGERHTSRIKAAMNRVSDYLDGKSPYSVLAGPKTTNAESPLPPSDPVSAAIITVDILAVFGAITLFFLWKKK